MGAGRDHQAPGVLASNASRQFTKRVTGFKDVKATRMFSLVALHDSEAFVNTGPFYLEELTERLKEELGSRGPALALPILTGDLKAQY
jgi:hypothetical protein